MRSHDLHMASTIDLESRVIMSSGAIDQNNARILMRIKVPEPGLYTLVKTETNLTDQSWTSWLMNLGEGVTMPIDDPTNMLLSRQFKKSKYLPELGAVLFYDGEVRPGDSVLKIARFKIQAQELQLCHSRSSTPKGLLDDLDEDQMQDPADQTYEDDDDDTVYKLLNTHYADVSRKPVIEVFSPVHVIRPKGVDIVTFDRDPALRDDVGNRGFFGNPN